MVHLSRLIPPVARRLDAGLPVAALLALFIIQPLLRPGLPTLADLPIHLYRTLEYGHAWAGGVIVPRWAPNLAYGYGYPLFVFAPPLPYAGTLAFYSLGLSLETAFKVLIILTILLYAIGMYLLARDLLHSVEAGLVAATAYAFAPFALREVLLYGGNLPQYLAIALFPWTLWAMTRAAQTHSWGWSVAAACFYAGIILSHLFHALIFTPVAVLYGLLQAGQFGIRYQRVEVKGQESGQKTKNSLPILYSLSSIFHSLSPILLGLLLTAFFWLPAFIERAFTRAQADIYLSKSPYYVRFLHWTELIAWIQPLDARAANPYVPLSLGVVTLVLAGLGLTLAIKLSLPIGGSLVGKGKSPTFPPEGIEGGRNPAIYLFFAVVATAAIYLTLPISQPIWEVVTILQVAEFPWRMLGLANLGLAFLAGAALRWFPPKLRPPVAAVCIVGLILAAAPLLYPVIEFTHYDQVTLANQVDYERRSQSIGTTTLGEYLPQTVQQVPHTSPLVEAFLAGQNPERLDRQSLPPGATATRLAQTAVNHLYRLDSPAGFTLRLLQFAYPGWQADLDGQPLPLKPEPKTGLILVDLPAGQHLLTLHFGETPIRLFALALSGITVGGLGVMGLLKRLGLKRQEPETRGDCSPVPPLPYAPAVLGVMLFILVSALWLKPLLRPVLTLDSPRGHPLPAQHQTDHRFANGIQLVGYDLNRSVVSAGDRLEVVLYWQTDTAPLKVNLQPFVHLDRLDNFTTVAGSTNYTPGDVTTESVLPTFHWDNNRYVRDEHSLDLPSDTPAQAYALRIGLIDPDQQDRLVPLADGSGDTAQLTLVNISPPGPSPRLAHPLKVTFGTGRESIHLTGFQLDSQTPERLDFRLSWQAGQVPQADYTVFAQLLDSANHQVASFDRPPLDGAYPTSTWLPGQTIVDPRYLPINHLLPGQYRLIVGLYHSRTGQRLPVTGGTDFVELTTITLGQP